MRIIKNVKISVLGLFLSILTINSQQITINNFHNINKIVYNPANAHDKELNAFFTSRQQWIGSDYDAPITNLLGFSKSLGEDRNAGVGFLLGYDTFSFLSRLSLKGMYSYRIPLSSEDDFFHNISFGVSGGLVQNQIDFNEIIPAPSGSAPP